MNVVVPCSQQQSFVRCEPFTTQHLFDTRPHFLLPKKSYRPADYFNHIHTALLAVLSARKSHFGCAVVTTGSLSLSGIDVTPAHPDGHPPVFSLSFHSQKKHKRRRFSSHSNLLKQHLNIQSYPTQDGRCFHFDSGFYFHFSGSSTNYAC